MGSFRQNRAMGVAGILGFAGCAAVVAGCVGVTRSSDLADQLSYLASGGIAGLLVVALALALALAAELKGIRGEIERLTQDRALAGTEADDVKAVQVAGHPGSEAAGRQRTEDGLGLGGPIVAVAGQPYFHRDTCHLVGQAGRQRVSAGQARTAGLIPCPTCSPVRGVLAGLLGAEGAEPSGVPPVASPAPPLLGA